MKSYKGIVRTIYENEIEINANNKDEALRKLRLLYEDDENNEGIFIANSNSFSNVEFLIKQRR